MTVKVPDTNTFSLQDVFNSVSSHASATAGNLQSCFSNAVNAYFDANYNKDSFAPANSMLRFRNYTPYIAANPTITLQQLTNITAGVTCVWVHNYEVMIKQGAVINIYPNPVVGQSDCGIDNTLLDAEPGETYRTGGKFWANQLSPNTTYYARTAVQTATGIWYSEQIYFTTLP